MVAFDEEVKIIRSVDTAVSTINFRSDNIVQVQIKKDVEIELAESKEIFFHLKSHFLETGNQLLVLVVNDGSAIVSREAREFGATDESSEITKAEAIIVKTIAHKLIINFTLKFYKPKRNMRMFTNETDALTWLKSFSYTLPDNL